MLAGARERSSANHGWFLQSKQTGEIDPEAN